MTQLPVFRLNSKADQRLRGGHLWIYSNEIDTKLNSLKSIVAGEDAVIENAQGKAIGIAQMNPNTLICGRIVSRNVNQPLSTSNFKKRIANALSLREMAFPVPCYRLVYGDSDLLPGLVVDRFYDVLVVQISTAGMERYIEEIVKALESVISPTAILLKNDGKMRKIEGLDSYVKWAKGDAGDFVPLEENGVKFTAPVIQGQKTGWFYDHRMTRARLAPYVQGKRVLDVFSYVGGWGIQAAAFGAKETWFTDTSAFALDQVEANAKLNNLSNIHTLQGDAFSVMEKLLEDGERFDTVILDPPSFIPRRKDIKKGIAAYQKANQLAMRLLPAQGGILVSGSCSMHLQPSDLRDTLRNVGRNIERNVQIIEQGHQGADHPIHPAIPETEYLKAFIARAYLN